jgi:hypothetical protein
MDKVIELEERAKEVYLCILNSDTFVNYSKLKTLLPVFGINSNGNRFNVEEHLKKELVKVYESIKQGFETTKTQNLEQTVEH